MGIQLERILQEQEIHAIEWDMSLTVNPTKYP